MSGSDPEIEQLRAGVNCAALLERLPPVWQLDRKESTRRCLKYRRGKGEALIVNHDGRGWWDVHSNAKGDVFDLVQFLEPSLNFGHVRRVLRSFVGVAPTFPEALRSRNSSASVLPLAERWRRRPPLRRGSPAWRYLTDARCLPVSVMMAAIAADIVREGPYGSAWFAHRDDAGTVTHIEIRGPDFKGALSGGTKTLFRLPGSIGVITRLAVSEGAINALSLAALENIRPNTLYVATGGGMGPETISALKRLLQALALHNYPRLVVATDGDAAGERYATRLHELVGAAGVPSERLHPPPGHEDWNALLQAQAGRVRR